MQYFKCLGFREAAETRQNQNVLTPVCPHLPQINPIHFLVMIIEFLSMAKVVTAEVDHPTHCDEVGAKVSCWKTASRTMVSTLSGVPALIHPQTGRRATHWAKQEQLQTTKCR